MRIANSTQELHAFIEETAIKSHFELIPVPFDSQEDWQFREGVLSHKSNSFFHVAGIQHHKTREQHLILYQPQSALNGLAIHTTNGKTFLLLQARPEPGNTGVVQYGPTVQSTRANYLRMHGGKETSYLDLFLSYHPMANPLGNLTQTDLGKRYFQKNKVLTYIELRDWVETEENMIWVPLELLAEVTQVDNLLNTDLRSMLSVFDWDLYQHDFESRAESNKIKANELDRVCANRLGKKDFSLIPLSELDDWELGTHSIRSINATKPWVEMYKVTCLNREVHNWAQPLMSNSSRGLIVLLIRKVKDNFEFLIRYTTEFGISGQQTIQPTVLIYPGEKTEKIYSNYQNSLVIRQVVQSEEGGRFYKNENLYEVRLVEEPIMLEEDQFWIQAATLKQLLKTSCKVGIQMRCMSSLILDYLNPHSLNLSFNHPFK